MSSASQPHFAPVQRRAAVLIVVALLFLYATFQSSLSNDANENHYLTSQDEIVTLQTRPGVTLKAVVSLPTRPVSAVAIMFGGRDGRLLLDAKAKIFASKSFVMRVRAALTARGIAVINLDVPSDHRDGILTGYRETAAQAADTAKVLEWTRARWVVPSWFIGTSKGATAAANSAARLGSNGPEGIIFCSAVASSSGEDLTDMDLSTLVPPVLFLHHRDDSCKSAAYLRILGVYQQLSRVKKNVKLVTLEGGISQADDHCSPETHHGFYGIESRAANEIVRFMQDSSSSKIAKSPPPIIR